MQILIRSLSLILVINSLGFAQEQVTRVEFENDLVPLLTRYGCNAGACHGAAIGRGGFRLSLYGGDPKADYDAIVRQMRGRRVNLARPEESLLVLKPSEQVEHGGGAVIDDDGPAAKLLLDWIRQGASDESSRQLVRVVVTPPQSLARELGEPIQLRTVAHYSDGSQRDVTPWTVFAPEDDSAVVIDEQTYQATVRRRGRHIVVARYLTKVVPVELILPLTDSYVDLTSEQPNSFVDAEILSSLSKLGLEPSAGIDDAAFLRRVSLDLTGRLPSVEQRQRFVDRQQADKRSALVDELLGSEAFSEYWTYQLAKLLRIRPERNGDDTGARVYHRWLKEQVIDGESYQQIARDLIMGNGDTYELGPPNFHLVASGPREEAEFVSELFMGSRLRCANCHNHPLDDWTQDDYHGLAAIFAKISRGRTIQEDPGGKTIHPRTREPAVQRIPGEAFLSDDASAGRRQFVEWLTAEDNPYFAKAIVNRLWQRMMGRGLVEPVDDFRDTNPATHPALLNQLAEDFVTNGYQLRHTLRVIASSDAYARSATASLQNKNDDRFYSHRIRQPLEPEVLADAISDVLAVPDKYGGEPVGTRAVALVNPSTPSQTLDVLGRCGREESCEAVAGAVGGLAKKLHLMNGPLLNARIAVEGSRLYRLLREEREPLEIIEEFYLIALSRKPTQTEYNHWAKQLENVSDPPAFLEDFVWALMSSDEFVTNH